MEIKGNYGKVIIGDCVELMKNINGKVFDLCLTDPPYNINHKVKCVGQKNRVKEKEVKYKDNYSFEWNFQWFNKILRICKGLVFTCGDKYLYDWIRYKKPDYQLKYGYKINGFGFNLIEVLLFYGKVTGYKYLREIKEIKYTIQKLKLIHNTPKIYEFWYYIIYKLKPKSVIDPFIGSGTTAEVCEELGIKWLGFEIMDEYIPDIKKRINLGIQRRKQLKIKKLGDY